MKKVLVTGARGFIGRNMCLALRRSGGVEVLEIGSEDSDSDLAQAVAEADAVVHLAGVNRPEKEEEFVEGNVDFTRQLCDLLTATGRPIPVVVSSSIQAERDNAYGRSKAGGEQVLLDYGKATGSTVSIYRLPNVFGKWSRENYNTVVATFCHNISRGLPVQVNDPSALLTFVYVDEVVSEFVRRVENGKLKVESGDGGKVEGGKWKVESGKLRDEIDGVLGFEPSYQITLGDLHSMILGFKESRNTSRLADFGDPLTKYLYSTYLSFLDRDDFGYPVDLKTDDRGWLFELIKSEGAGQIFVSSTKPGITRGNHYHDTKVEKFCVVKGSGVIHFRHVLEDESFSYEVSDREIKVVDIPPGYTHSIENVGEGEMVTLFWANEIFDPERMDTYFEKVDLGKS